MSSLTETKDMKEMKENLQNYLLKVVDEDLEEDEHGNDNKIKTYILESNINSPDKITHFPRNYLLKSIPINPHFFNRVNGENPISSFQVFHTNIRFFLSRASAR